MKRAATENESAPSTEHEEICKPFWKTAHPACIAAYIRRTLHSPAARSTTHHQRCDATGRVIYPQQPTYLATRVVDATSRLPTSYRRPNFNARMHAYYPDFVSWRFVRPRRHRPAGTEREWERGSINYGVPTWKWSSLPPTRWFSARVREKGWE